MIRKFHEIRRHEEGQALVLAAIAMLILSLCALATVNLSFAVSQKMRLQNAADAGAYSIAAYEARALNFFAYSNRTMVVHYASQMNMMAIISYLIFSIAVWNALGEIPYIGIIFKIIAIIIFIIYIAIQIAFAVAMPLVDGINLGLWAAQNGVSQGMLQRTQVESLQEVRNYSGDYRLTHLSTMTQSDAWKRSVNVSSFPSLRGPDTFEEQLDRTFMTEIANSARHPWTAFGLTKIQLLLIPRQASINLFFLDIGKYARTEYGQLQNGATRGIFFGLFNVPTTEEIFSVDQFRIIIGIANLVGIQFKAEAWVSANRAFGEARFGNRSGAGYISTFCNLPFPANLICSALLAPFVAGLNAGIAQFMASIAPYFTLPLNFHFGQLPYARFRAAASGQQLFNQPPVALVVTLPTGSLQRIARPFMGDFGVRLGHLSSGSSPLMQPYGGSRSSQRGFRSSVNFRPAPNAPAGLAEGLHAASAALAYYHRPGDWREPPNLFNPLWGAKLIPILDHPMARQHPILQPLVSGNRLVVH